MSPFVDPSSGNQLAELHQCAAQLEQTQRDVESVAAALQRSNERCSQLETEKRVVSDLLWACPLPELRAFVGFFVRIAQSNQAEQGRKLLAWADDAELMR